MHVLKRRKKTGVMQETRGDRWFLRAVYVYVGLVMVVVLIPLLFIIASSLSSPEAVQNGRVWLWPVHPTLLGYRLVLTYPAVISGFINSLIYTAGYTVVAVIVTVFMAYPLSRRGLYGRSVFVWLLLIAFLFNGGLIPLFLVIKSLGILNTRWAMIFPGALNIFWIMIARAYLVSAIPDELYQAAEVDGCSAARFFWSIVLPLSKPIIAVVALLAAVGQWNSYFFALIFLNDPHLYSLQLVLRELLLNNNIQASQLPTSVTQQASFAALQTSMRYALIVVGSLPMLALYPIAQRYFVKGVLVGSLKE